MVKRSVHYEAAFEDYLRTKGIPYVGVDEKKRALFKSIKLKSFDFVVYSETGGNLLVDVKGRKFPDIIPGRKRRGVKAWENWVMREDVEGLMHWEKIFRENFRGVFVFAYWLQGPPENSPFDDLHFFRENYYAFMGVTLKDYLTAAKPRSKKWETIGVPSSEFAKMARDITDLL
ncbi:MAG: HYExAFE family protein [Phycisphaerae bacterium]|nr:HYExAFE family protein [Phycisphaerae bacterium]